MGKEPQHDIHAAPKLCHMTIPQSRSRNDVFCWYEERRKLSEMDPYNHCCVLIHGCLIF